MLIIFSQYMEMCTPLFCLTPVHFTSRFHLLATVKNLRWTSSTGLGGNHSIEERLQRH